MSIASAIPQSSPATVLTKAVARAAARLEISNIELGRVLGVSPPTVTRLKRGDYALDATSKPFELAALLVRVFRSLDAIVGGDDAAAASWLRADNLALKDKPIHLIQKVAGLTHVLQYLDTRRAQI